MARFSGSLSLSLDLDSSSPAMGSLLTTVIVDGTLAPSSAPAPLASASDSLSLSLVSA